MSDAAANLRPPVDPFLEFGDWSAVERIGEVSFTTVEGYELVVFDPRKRPQLWKDYLYGAIREYRRFDVEKALTLDENSDGHDVSAVFAIRDGGTVIGGIRAHGPITETAGVAAIREVADSPDAEAYRQFAASLVATECTIEAKGTWSDYDRPDRRQIAVCVSRCVVHAARLLGATSVFATTPAHTSKQYEITGARAVEGIAPSPYPDDRYETRPIIWALNELTTHCDPTELAHLAVEWDRFVTAFNRAVRATDWRIEILGDDDESAARIAELMSDGRVQLVDDLAATLAELPKGLEHTSVDARWVWYPWRDKLVRLPGPELFRSLRTDRNRNKLTVEEQQTLQSRTVGIVGLSVGHLIAYTLAAESVGGRLKIIDGDVLELTNMNRIPGSVCDLGVNKAVGLARRILELDPYVELDVFTEDLTQNNVDEFLDGLDLVVEECDSLDVKIMLRHEARRRGLPVLMHTSDRGLLDIERFDADGDRPILHGLVGDLTPEGVAGLSTEDKVPYVLRILDPSQVSARLAASLIEVGEDLSTWPQLAEDVVLGAAAITATARRILTGQDVPSGRLRFDIDTDPTTLLQPAPPQRTATTPIEVEPEPVELIDALAWAAGRAPSGGNVQPWRFNADVDHFEIGIDQDKTTMMDVGFRGSQVALGAALFNAEVVAASRDRLGAVSVSGDGAAVRGRIDLATGRGSGHSQLAGAVPIRATNRSDGTGEPLHGDFRAALFGWAEQFGASFHLIEDTGRRQAIGDLLAAADRIRYLDQRLHAEMMSELRWPGEDASTGIDIRTLGLPPADLAVLDILSRADVTAEVAGWRGGRALGDPAAEAIEDASAVLVACAKGTDGSALVNAGRAVQAAWLEATAAGYGFHPWSPVFLYAYRQEDCLELVDVDRAVAVWTLTEKFRAVTGVAADEWPALVIRVTKPKVSVSQTGRLPYRDLLTLRR